MELKLIYSKIPRNHSFFINSVFYHLFPTGPDLGNIEIKECTNENNVFKVKKKDMKVDYILFYSHREEMFYYCDSSFFNTKTEVKVSSEKLKDYSILCTKDSWEIVERVEKDIIDIRILNPELLTEKMRLIEDGMKELKLSFKTFAVNESIQSINSFILQEGFRKKNYNVFIENSKGNYYVCNSTSIEKGRKRLNLDRVEKISFFSARSIDDLLNEMTTLA